jgi:hypothetical protein
MGPLAWSPSVPAGLSAEQKEQEGNIMNITYSNGPSFNYADGNSMRFAEASSQVIGSPPSENWMYQSAWRI